MSNDSKDTEARVSVDMVALKEILAREPEPAPFWSPAPAIQFDDFSDPERCRYFRVPGEGLTKGLDVAFRFDGAVGLFPVDERIEGFAVKPAAALILRDLMVHVLGNPLYNIVAEDFALAVPPEVADAE